MSFRALHIKRPREDDSKCGDGPFSEPQAKHARHGPAKGPGTPPHPSSILALPTAPTVMVIAGRDQCCLLLPVDRPKGFPELERDIPSQVTCHSLGALFNVHTTALVSCTTGEAFVPDAEGRFPLHPLRHHGIQLQLHGSRRPEPPDPRRAQERRHMRELVVKHLQQELRWARDMFQTWRMKVQQREKAGRLHT
uniref:Uncharacterized protein n=1 Tax=Eutreptiella gymnastica TaxID=73025 RepID=A0A7S1J9L7_9EUGL